ncbi:MAG TPA: histidine kinase [Thermoanaerobaculia bacterium]|nr:histidine kinase [Thermoanaerobaculia bacterium]
MTPLPASRLLRWMGVLAALAAAVPVFLRAAEDAAFAGPRLIAWALLLAAFVALFWWLGGGACERLSPRLRLAALGAASGTGLALAWLGRSAFGGVFMVLVAALLAALPPRQAAAWLAVQSLALAGALAAHFGWVDGLVLGTAFGALQLFALQTARTAQRERAARQELELANQALREARLRLDAAARDTERLRIARELHDLMGHHLTALGFSLEAATHCPPTQVAAHVAAARDLVGELLHDVREVVSAFRGEAVLDLAAGLRVLAASVDEPRVHVEVPASLLAAPTGAHALLRCAQEVVTNSIRHGGGRNLWLQLRDLDGGLLLAARDDGRGAAGAVEGHGLRGMRERLEELGGWMRWQSEEGRGFRLQVWLPPPASGP